LLNADDYFTKENSIKAIYKVQIIFKVRILKLISRVYLQENSPLIQRQLEVYRSILNTFIEESAARLETHDFRKIIILKEVKQEEHFLFDYRMTELYTITYGDTFLIEVYLAAILKFAEIVRKT
jgi:hypothetical protein